MCWLADLAGDHLRSHPVVAGLHPRWSGRCFRRRRGHAAGIRDRSRQRVGGAWVAMAIVARVQLRSVATRVSLSESAIVFEGRNVIGRVPVSRVVAFQWQRMDVQRLAPASFLTADSGRIKVAPRMDGLFELLIAVRDANPEFVV